MVIIFLLLFFHYSSSTIPFPGSRYYSATYMDSTGSLWLFGGNGYSEFSNGYLNDLWLFSNNVSYWISGTTTANAPSLSGVQGVASVFNYPGGRQEAVMWIDSIGSLWLFGGYGYDANSKQGSLNDLWKFSNGMWTWVSGSNVVNMYGSYGAQGVPSLSNNPGARYGSVGWIDSAGTLWLFGGQGYDANSNLGSLNDLWSYSNGMWTWISGASFANALGVYGTRGVPSTSSYPGARFGSVGWIDSAGALWLFGGQQSASSGNRFNDVWKYAKYMWTYVSGSESPNAYGVYGTQGVTAAYTYPGARVSSASCIDSAGTLWLFGGQGYDAINNIGSLNDLWSYSNGMWTWISGASSANAPIVYGTQGVPSLSNNLGARFSSTVWIAAGHLWIFGGNSVSASYSNDLWSYSNGMWTWVSGSKVQVNGVYGNQGLPVSSSVITATSNTISTTVSAYTTSVTSNVLVTTAPSTAPVTAAGSSAVLSTASTTVPVVAASSSAVLSTAPSTVPVTAAGSSAVLSSAPLVTTTTPGVSTTVVSSKSVTISSAPDFVVLSGLFLICIVFVVNT